MPKPTADDYAQAVFSIDDLPTLRRMRDAMRRLHEDAKSDPDAVTYRLQTAFAAEFCARVVERLEAEYARCPASTMGGSRCEGKRFHSGKHVSRGYEWSDEDARRQADQYGSRFD